MTLFLGFYGESVSYSSGSVSLAKLHGDAVRMFGGRGTDFEMKRTSKNGIILIRNPFEAIYSYRKYINDDLFGYNNDSSIFFGDGNKYH